MDAISPIHEISGHNLGILSITGAQNSRAITSSLDCHIRVLDLKNGTTIKKFDVGSGELWKIALHPNFSQVASGSQKAKINVIDLEAEKIISEIPTESKFVMSVVYVREHSAVRIGTLYEYNLLVVTGWKVYRIWRIRRNRWNLRRRNKQTCAYLCRSYKTRSLVVIHIRWKNADGSFRRHASQRL